MEKGLWTRFDESECYKDREQLIEYYLPFAKQVALSLYKVWQDSEIQAEDFIQYATVGLIESIDSFDSTFGVSFKYYARFRIKGAVLNAISSYSENLDCRTYRRQVEMERRNSIRKIVEGKKTNSFEKFYQLVVNYAVIQLLDNSSDLEELKGIAETSPYSHPVECSIRLQLVELLDRLPERNRAVLKLHYIEDMNFTEIAGILGLSKATISLAHAEGISLLRVIYHKTGSLDKNI